MAIDYSQTSDVSPEDYVLVGVATCFVRVEGQTDEVQVLEPIPSSALGALVAGVPTSYSVVYGTQVGQVWSDGAPQRLAEFPPEAEFSRDFGERVISAARTYKRERNRTVSTDGPNLIPVGTSRSEFQYSLERKRVLNAETRVKPEDNVKQHAYTHQVL